MNLNSIKNRIFHIPGYNFCGLFTPNLYYKRPINQLDRLCRQHDMAYTFIKCKKINREMNWIDCVENLNASDLLLARNAYKNIICNRQTDTIQKLCAVVVYVAMYINVGLKFLLLACYNLLSSFVGLFCLNK
jgi:hypothetical protein